MNNYFFLLYSLCQPIHHQSRNNAHLRDIFDFYDGPLHAAHRDCPLNVHHTQNVNNLANSSKMLPACIPLLCSLDSASNSHPYMLMAESL